MGAAVAVNVAEGLILLFLFLIYKGSRNKEKKQEESQKKRNFPDSVRILYGSMGSSVLIRVFERLPLFLGLLFFLKSTQDGQQVRNFLREISCRMYACDSSCLRGSASCLRKSGAAAEKGRISLCKELSAERRSFYIGRRSVFCGVFRNNGRNPWCASLRGRGAQGKTLEKMLLFGSVVILFAVLSFFFREKLLLFSGKKYPVLCALGLMNAAFVLPLTLFLNLGKAGPGGHCIRVGNRNACFNGFAWNACFQTVSYKA